MAVTMKNGIFWDVTPCGSCKNRRFGGTYQFHQQGDKNSGTVFILSVRQSLVTANIVPSFLILVTLMMEELYSSETLVFTRAT
jgi:hypothetical protein